MSTSYRRGYRRSYAPTVGRIAKANARPGPCHYCGKEVAAGDGQLWRDQDGAWSAVHVQARWVGSPVSGRYAGGCPEETARLNRSGGWA